MNTQAYDSPVKAAWNGIVDLFRKDETAGVLSDSDRIDGKVCLVTGANSGLGMAIASELAHRGGRVVMAGRSMDDDAHRKIMHDSGSDEVSMEYVDMADLNSINDFCRRMKEKGKCFDTVVLNAGVVAKESRKTAQGFEEMFLVNYLANFMLVNRLLKDGTIPNSTFCKNPRNGDRSIARILFISSESHRSARMPPEEEIGKYVEYSISSSMAQYGMSKLLLTVYAVELQRRLASEEFVDVSVFSICPGAVNTNIAREAPAWSKPLLSIVFKLFFQSPEKAARPAVYLCCSDDVEGETGVYLHNFARKTVSADALDPVSGAALWDMSERLISDQGQAPESWSDD